MAIACFLLFTTPPFPPFPDRRVPCFLRRIALLTVLLAAFPYLAIAPPISPLDELLDVATSRMKLENTVPLPSRAHSHGLSGSHRGLRFTEANQDLSVPLNSPVEFLICFGNIVDGNVVTDDLDAVHHRRYSSLQWSVAQAGAGHGKQNRLQKPTFSTDSDDFGTGEAGGALHGFKNFDVTAFAQNFDSDA
jgi:hypothetical protein